MTIKKAKEQLTIFRQQQRSLRKQIDSLRDWLRKKGIDPDAPALDLTARNNAMYSRYLDGLTWAEMAKEYKLSKERIKQICRRIEFMNEKNACQAKREPGN